MATLNNVHPTKKPDWQSHILAILIWLFMVVPPLFFIPGKIGDKWVYAEYEESKLAAIMVLFWALAAFFFVAPGEKALKTLKKVACTPTFVLLFFITCYSLVSSLWASVPEAALYEAFQWFSLTFMFLIFSSLFVRDARWLHHALKAVVFSFLIVTVIGLIQTRVQIPFLLPVPGTKIGSTFGAKNTCFLSLASQFFLVCYLFSLNILTNKRLVSVWFTIAIVIELVYMVISRSRTTYASITIGFIWIYVVGLVWANDKIRILKIGVAAIALVAITLSSTKFVFPRMWGSVSYQVSHRILPLIDHPAIFFTHTARGQVILDSWDMIKDHPYGVGAGNWMFLYPLYHKHLQKKAFNKIKQIRNVHNDYVQYLAELGFPGFIALLGLIGIQIKSLVFALNTDHRALEKRLLAYFLLPQFLSVCIMLFFSFYLEFPYRKFLFVFLLALIFGVSRYGKREWAFDE